MNLMQFEEANALIDKIGAVSIMEHEERKHLFEKAREVNSPVCEVGCSHGGTTILLTKATDNKVFAIDNWQSGQKETFFKNLSLADSIGSVEIINEDSTEAAKRFSDNTFGLVIIDAEHEGDKPYEDIIAWAPKVKRGGYLLIDDTACQFPAVTKAVFKFLSESSDFAYVDAFEHPKWERQIKLLSLLKK